MIEDIGHARGQEPMHLIYAGIIIYAGVIDKLCVTRSTLRRSHYYGHIVKSRARHTEISDSYLLGQGSINSREGDMPCGGVIEMTRVVIQKGPNADNNESFGVGLEPNHCRGRLHSESSFRLTDSWLIFDRPKGQFGYLRGYGKPVILGNKIIGLRTWGSFSDHSAVNKMYRSRAEAGLERAEIPRLSIPLPRELSAK